MLKNTAGGLICLVWLGMFPVLCHGENMASESYEIKARVMSAGGGAMGSQSYENKSTLGQPTPIAGEGVLPGSASYTLMPGFWYQVRPGECECRLKEFSRSFGENTGTPSNCCDIDWDGDVDGQDLFLLIPGL